MKRLKYYDLANGMVRGWWFTNREVYGILLSVFLIQLVHAQGRNRLPISPVSKSLDPLCLRDCSNAKPKQICGTNDRTFNSNCEFKKFRACSGSSIKIKHKGPCTSGQTKCEVERTAAQDQVETSTGDVFIPQCNADGSYATVQCYISFGYCWCVNREGKPIPGTSVEHQRPTCDGELPPVPVQNDNSINPVKEVTDGCDLSERAKFNDNLRRIFREEYKRILSLPATDSTERVVMPTGSDLDKSSIEWKFTELDTNNDFYLSKKELVPMRRLMKKLVKPKSCVKSFQTHCDLDNDNSIAETEWSFCLGGVDNNEHQYEGPLDSTSSREDSPPILVKRQQSGTAALGSSEQPLIVLSCPVERQRAAMEAERLPSNGVFIPACSEGGLYRAMQCHEQAQYCWCVYVNTGRSIPGTSSRAPFKQVCSDVAWSQTPVLTNEFRDCPDDKKGRFLSKLVDMFATTMNSAQESDRSTETPNINTIKIVLWKFHQLDTSENGILEETELEQFSATVDEVRASKKCRRNFLSYCDVNGDSTVTQREWLMCFEVNGADAIQTTASITRNPVEHQT